MGSTMKPVIFGDNVASPIRTWHQTAKLRPKSGRPSGNVSPLTSRPATPLHGGSSPVHLKQYGYQKNIAQYYPPVEPSPRRRIEANQEISSRQSFDHGSEPDIELSLSDFSLVNKIN